MRAHSQPILVFGEALVDIFGDVLVLGGAPFNVARHLAGLGFNPILLTRLGKDKYADLIYAEMDRFGMSTIGIQSDTTYPTGSVKVEETGTGKHVFSILSDQAYDHFDNEMMAQVALPEELSIETYLYYGSLAQRSVKTRNSLIGLRNKLEKKITYFDLNWREGHVSQEIALQEFLLADEIKVNEEELDMVLSWVGLSSSYTKIPPKMGDRCPSIATLMMKGVVKTLIVTYGDRGYAAYSSDGLCMARGDGLIVPKMMDTVGAGDAFSSIILAGRIAGWTLDVCLARANAFAVAICGVRGAVPQDIDFYKFWRDEWAIS